MSEIPEIVWPSGFVKESFYLDVDFNMLMKGLSGIYFEDKDELGIFMVYYAELADLGHILLIKHKEHIANSITAYIDKNASVSDFLQYLKHQFNFGDESVIWSRPSFWHESSR